MRVWPEVSGGGVGHRARRNGNSWRHASTWGVDGALVIPLSRLLREQRGLGVSLYPGVKGGAFFSRVVRAVIIQG